MPASVCSVSISIWSQPLCPFLRLPAGSKLTFSLTVSLHANPPQNCDELPLSYPRCVRGGRGKKGKKTKGKEEKIEYRGRSGFRHVMEDKWTDSMGPLWGEGGGGGLELDAKARLWEDVKRCREAQLDQAIYLNSLELLAPFLTLHHLTLSEHNQTHFNRGHLNRAKCALAVFSNIAIRQILRSSYISLHLSLWFRGQGIRSCFEYVSSFCVCVLVRLMRRPLGWPSLLNLC